MGWLIDLVAVLPWYLPFFGVDLRFARGARMFRLLRVAKFSRYSRAIHTFGRVFYAKKEELKKPKQPSHVLGNEYLMKAMDGEMAVHLEVHRAADILRALEIKRKYHLDLVLVGCTEGYLVADAIKKAGVPVILGPVRRTAVREANEFFNHRADCAAILAAKGIPIALAGSGRQPMETRFVALNAALAAGAGLCPRVALEAITVSAAAILGVKDSIGSLEKGKDADIVLVRGCPLESDGQVEKVLVNGKVVYSKEK